MLFLNRMNKLTRRALILFTVYLVVSLGLTLLVVKIQTKDKETIDTPQLTPTEHIDRIQPNEEFYLDRSFQTQTSHPKTYLEQLEKAMSYDRTVARLNRGLDHPWTLQGPGNIGGRVNAIAVHPTDAETILLGYSQGGIYRTEDGGQQWDPVFDDQTSLAISHITYDPHDDSMLWATTGDVNISGYPFIGSGVYSSDDGGLSWTNRGLQHTGVLSKVLVDPFLSDIVYVGSMGYPSLKGEERGLFRSIDGGNSWEKTLTINDSTGVVDLVTDPLTPGRLYASGWTRIRSSTVSTNLGPGTMLYMSENYGATWTNITNGLPNEVHSRTSIEITNDGTLFISYLGEITQGGCQGNIESLQSIYKSVDGGMSWTTIPTAPENGVYCDMFGQFGWYFEVLKVNPQNPMDMFLLGVEMLRTVDGGENWFDAVPPWWSYEVHADKHELVFAHGDLYLATDGGAYRTDIAQFEDWKDIENIPSTQFYRTTWNPHAPDMYYGGAQDNGTSSGNASTHNEWRRLLGGDGFQPLFDPEEQFWMYGLTQNGRVYVSVDTMLNFNSLNRGLKGTRYWDMPIVMSTHDSKKLYCGSNRMFQINMLDSLREWREISPDLTRGDTILGNRYPAITAIAQSELDEDRLYAGTQDGLLWTTADGGDSWIEITDGTPGIFVTSLTCSTIDPFGVIATYSGYRDNDQQPYIYRSDDAGASWEPIQSDLPMMGVNSFLILPGWNDAVLFAATDGGVYVSQDAGSVWERVGSNMPYTPVYDLEYNPVTNTLIAATFSRGIMTFPVEELDLINATKEKLVENRKPEIMIYPTITSGELYLAKTNDEILNNYIQFTIYSLQGDLIESRKLFWSSPMKITIDPSIPAGVYLASVQIGDLFETHRFIKQ